MITGVLVVVHEHSARIAVLAPPGGGRLGRRPPFHLSREGQRRPADVGKPPLRLDPHVDVQARPARGLRPADRAKLVEHLSCDVGNAADPLKTTLGHGVQVDAPLVGAFDVGAPGVPRMKLDRGHLHRPDHGCQLGDAELVGMAVVPREAHPHGLHPGRSTTGKPLLVHLLAADPLREPVQHGGPLAQRANDPVAHAEVVLSQVELGLTAGREVDPVRVGDAQAAAGHVQLDCWGAATRGGHESNLTSFHPSLQRQDDYLWVLATD